MIHGLLAERREECRWMFVLIVITVDLSYCASENGPTVQACDHKLSSLRRRRRRRRRRK